MFRDYERCVVLCMGLLWFFERNFDGFMVQSGNLYILCRNSFTYSLLFCECCWYKHFMLLWYERLNIMGQFFYLLTVIVLESFWNEHFIFLRFVEMKYYGPFPLRTHYYVLCVLLIRTLHIAATWETLFILLMPFLQRCLLQLQNLTWSWPIFSGSHETYQLRLQVSMLAVHTFILKRPLAFLADHVWLWSQAGENHCRHVSILSTEHKANFVVNLVNLTSKCGEPE